MKKFDIVVVGGGFAGIYSAWRLAQDGASVMLIESSSHMGGILWSFDWRGFLVDVGTHHLDTRTEVELNFYRDVLGDASTLMVDHDWCSTTGRHWTHGFENPDFTLEDPEFCISALEEIISRTDIGVKCNTYRTYKEWLSQRYGNIVTNKLLGMVEKVSGYSIDYLAPEASDSLGMFSRIKLGGDRLMAALKEKNDRLDSCLAVTNGHSDIRFKGKGTTDGRFEYPKAGALRQFCIAAEDRLRSLGVHLIFSSKVCAIDASRNSDACSITVTDGTQLHSYKILWTLPLQSLLPLIGAQQPTEIAFYSGGFSLHVFEVDRKEIIGPDYLHDFSLHRKTYRYARPGVYGFQTRSDGRTFVIAEVPYHPDSMLDADLVSSIVWRDLRNVGYLRSSANCYDKTARVYPNAYQLPKVGWKEIVSRTDVELEPYASRIKWIESSHRGRYRFIEYFERKLRYDLRSNG